MMTTTMMMMMEETNSQIQLNAVGWSTLVVVEVMNAHGKKLILAVVVVVVVVEGDTILAAVEDMILAAVVSDTILAVVVDMILVAAADMIRAAVVDMIPAVVESREHEHAAAAADTLHDLKNATFEGFPSAKLVTCLHQRR